MTFGWLRQAVLFFLNWTVSLFVKESFDWQDKITQQENVLKANFQALTARVNGKTKLQEVSQSNLERLVPSATVSLGNLRFKTTVNGYGWTSTRDLGWAFLRMCKSYGMAFCLPSCFTMVSFDSFSRRSQRSTAWFQRWEFRMLLKEITHFFFFSIYFLSLPVSFLCFLRKWHWFLFFFRFIFRVHEVVRERKHGYPQWKFVSKPIVL